MLLFQILMQNKFQEKLNQLIEQKSSFLLFRKPHGAMLELWFDEKIGENQFVFNRFDNQEKIIFTTDHVLETPIEDLEFSLQLPVSEMDESISHEQYTQLISETVNELKNSDTEKIVISRIKEIPNQGIHIAKTLKNIHTKYPQAYVYLWYSTDHGVWVGASPELLLKEKNFKIETVSLAGTLPKDEEWTTKEIHEQQVVTDYIVANLNGSRNIMIDGPHTVDAGYFNHLKSYISAEVNSYDEVENILNRLHPTPAVCGMPKIDAHRYILNHEGYDRKFYAGYFGYKTLNESEYFVNLRCAQLFENVIKLYVGGGIMPDSIPEKEWQETELKSKTIGNLLVTD